ncbi:unnamed protein product, partial [Lampetra planeri]
SSSSSSSSRSSSGSSSSSSSSSSRSSSGSSSSSSSSSSSRSSSGSSSRKGLKAWLLEQVDGGRYPGLRWEEGAGRQLFRLPWKHASKHDYTHADSALFRAWAEHKGRFRAGVDKPDPPGWKTRLRCAMNKSRDFVEETNRGQADISHPYKVYRVLSQRAAPPPTPAVVSSPCGSLDSHEEDKDTDNGHPRPARIPLYALMGLEETSNRKIEADAMDTNDDVASPPMIGGSAEDPANIDQLEEELGPKASAFRVTVSYRGRQLLCCTVTNSSGCLITSHSACGREPANGSAALEVTRTHSYARRVAGPATPGNRTPPPSHWTPATADGPAPDSAGPVQDESSSSPSPLPLLLLPSSSDDCAGDAGGGCGGGDCGGGECGGGIGGGGDCGGGGGDGPTTVALPSAAAFLDARHRQAAAEFLPTVARGVELCFLTRRQYNNNNRNDRNSNNNRSNSRSRSGTKRRHHLRHLRHLRSDERRNAVDAAGGDGGVGVGVGGGDGVGVGGGGAGLYVRRLCRARVFTDAGPALAAGRKLQRGQVTLLFSLEEFARDVRRYVEGISCVAPPTAVLLCFGEMPAASGAHKQLITARIEPLLAVESLRRVRDVLAKPPPPSSSPPPAPGRRQDDDPGSLDTIMKFLTDTDDGGGPPTHAQPPFGGDGFFYDPIGPGIAV